MLRGHDDHDRAALPLRLLGSGRESLDWLPMGDPGLLYREWLAAWAGFVVLGIRVLWLPHGGWYVRTFCD
jgi:hypothetical protein